MKRRLELIQTAALSEDDIEELYGEDQPTLETIKNIARSEIPTEVDDIIEAGLSETDVEFGELDFLLREIARVFVFAGRVSGSKIKWNILLTKVENLVMRAPTEELTVTMNSPSVMMSCPECGEELGVDPNFCSNCDWESEKAS